MSSKAKTKKNTPSLERNIEDEDHASNKPASHDDADSMGVRSEDKLEIILKEIRDFRGDSNRQFADLKHEITKTNSRVDEVEKRIITTEDRVQMTEEVLTELVKQHVQLKQQLSDLQGRSRRKNIRIYGVPEQAEGSSPSTFLTFVEKLLRENLGIPPHKDLQIERAHRAFGPRPPAHGKPRSIVVRFQSYRTKDEILQAAWQKKGLMFNNSKVSLDHDYAPDVLARRREYGAIRRILKEKDIRFKTLFPARLRVFFKEETKTYDTPEDAASDLADRGLPVSRAVRTDADTLLGKLRQHTWTSVPTRRTKGFKEKLQAFRWSQAENTDT
uniref:L1 transposable element RRM domain-containing protein n=1 Tax=Amphiprion ocellaris TaxID=80972 RepID=A0AAQ6AQA3_AMPOC